MKLTSLETQSELKSLANSLKSKAHELEKFTSLKIKSLLWTKGLHSGHRHRLPGVHKISAGAVLERCWTMRGWQFRGTPQTNRNNASSPHSMKQIRSASRWMTA